MPRELAMFLRAWAVKDTYSEILLVVFANDCTSPSLLSRNSFINISY